MSKTYPTDWICTDSDTEQYGRQLSDLLFEFKENGKDETVINMSEGVRETKEIEHCINSYGYTLLSGENQNPKLMNIVDVYGDTSLWIIAECLFEMDM